MFAANYSFLQHNLTVPGASKLAVEAGEGELLQFLSQPVIFSLSINNRSTSLANTSQPVRISFQHNGVSFVLGAIWCSGKKMTFQRNNLTSWIDFLLCWSNEKFRVHWLRL